MPSKPLTLISFRIPTPQIKPLRIKAAQSGCPNVAEFLRRLIEREVAAK